MKFNFIFVVQHDLNYIICVEHGLSIVEQPKRRGKSYDQWLGDKKKPSHRETLRYSIDGALDKKPKTFDELLKLLQEAGYEIKPRGKDISFRRQGEDGFIRLSSLKEPYTKDLLVAVIKGERQHRKKRRPGLSSPPKPSLLVDIDKKLQEGKGTGYKKWAGNFNLKQMAQTMTYDTCKQKLQ